MLNHTRKIKEIYEDIQRKLYYMIPEKWEDLYLYSSVLDKPDSEGKTGELFFYYIPKGILKKKPVNVYEIPSRFNLDENQYISLVGTLYNKIKELRNEFKRSESGELWSNITITIHGIKFKVDYDYTDLVNSDFNSYERHIIWRYKNLNIGLDQVNKEEKEILSRYLLGAKTLSREEHYETGIYIQDVDNRIGYSKDEYDDIDTTQNVEYVSSKDQKKNKNQILLSQEEINRIKQDKNNN